MQYFKINWIHNFEDSPSVYLLEIDSYGIEQRKIEKYKNGNINIASNEFEVGTFLTTEIFDKDDYNYESSIEKISVVEISHSEFYKEWKEAIEKNIGLI